MVTQITSGIKISVLTNFEDSFYRNYKLHFSFSYEITIENNSKDSVQLISRHWEILNSLENVEIVDGEGVIGQKPVIKPGEIYKYSSGCYLTSTFGAMRGYYNMINFTTAKNFKVIVPSFRLSTPFALN